MCAVLALCTSLSAAIVSDADATTLLPTRSGALERPAALYYGGANFALPGVGYSASGLRWRGWGRGAARATGRLRICPNMTPCTRMRVQVAASGLDRRAEGTADSIYSYVSFTRVGAPRPLLKLCVYGEACKIGPVG